MQSEMLDVCQYRYYVYNFSFYIKTITLLLTYFHTKVRLQVANVMLCRYHSVTV